MDQNGKAGGGGPKGPGILEDAKAAFTISGTIVGAGILALPIAMAELGFLPGFCVLALMGAAFLFTALYIGEAAIAAGEPISLIGLAKKHFGTPGLVVMLAGILIYIYGALIGYLSAGGQVIYDLSGGRVPQQIGMLVYFSCGAAIIYCGIRFLKTAAFFLFGSLLALFFFLNYFALAHVVGARLATVGITKLFSVFGVVFFAYNGHSIIPAIANQYRAYPARFKTIACVGVAIPFFLFSLWCFTAIGSLPYSGDVPAASALTTATLMDAKAFSQPATIPLGHLYGGAVILIGVVFSLFATFTSFLGFGFSLAENLMDFFKKRSLWIVAVALALVPPLLFNFVQQGSFLKALEIAGMYGAGVFAGIMPCLIILKVRREQLARPLALREKAGPLAIFALFFAVLLYTTFMFFVS